MVSNWISKRAVLVGGAVLLAMAASAWLWQTRYAVSGSVGGQFLEVRSAHAKAKSGQVVLVDVRRPSEWKSSGVPASGFAITMHQNNRNFIKQLLAATGGDKARPLALICATGGRTTWLQPHLRRAGFTNLINVTEGMMGSRYGAGWLKKGLPIRKWSGSGSMRP